LSYQRDLSLDDTSGVHSFWFPLIWKVAFHAVLAILLFFPLAEFLAFFALLPAVTHRPLLYSV